MPLTDSAGTSATRPDPVWRAAMTRAMCRLDCHSSSDEVAGRVYKIKVSVGGTNPRSVL